MGFGTREQRDAEEAMRRNDARYRWLRCGGWEVLQDPKYWQPERGFDGAVDAAMLDVSLNAAMAGANTRGKPGHEVASA